MKIELDLVIQRIMRRCREHVWTQNLLNNVERSHHAVFLICLRTATDVRKLSESQMVVRTASFLLHSPWYRYVVSTLTTY